MAMQSFQLDPNHTHNYRKITRIGVDENKNWNSPTWEDVIDDGDSVAVGTTDLEGAAITTATSVTSTPN